PNSGRRVIAYLCADLYVANGCGYRAFRIVICIATRAVPVCAGGRWLTRVVGNAQNIPVLNDLLAGCQCRQDLVLALN
ncbi:MAG: hypothetical protein ACRDPD_06570, partial [Streptosporangiaceae bacterium]